MCKAGIGSRQCDLRSGPDSLAPAGAWRRGVDNEIYEPVILKIRLMINIYFFRKSRLKQKAGSIVFKSLLASENGCGGGWKHFRGFDNPVKNANENLSIHCSSAF